MAGGRGVGKGQRETDSADSSGGQGLQFGIRHRGGDDGHATRMAPNSVMASRVTLLSATDAG